ncbi:MAG: MBL fold metallo-hydrolase [Ruminococcaceae bacterium]|nr:MBL fold metallo-hydrolase [Oscillospiraceae bacterium]
MKLTVLCDNSTRVDAYYLAEPGVSYYLEDGDQRILFDTGYSDVYVKNAQALGIDLSQVTMVVLSHGHNDHTGGLAHFPAEGIPLVAHPEVFGAKEYEGEKIGSPLTQQQAGERFRLQLSREPVALTERLTFLGEIPRLHDFEGRRPIGRRLVENGWEADLLPDDTALAYRGEEGLWIITGCSHAGICNIVEHAKKVCGEERICGIVGGFHLMEADLQTEETIRHLKRLRPRYMRPCHCTCFAARAAIHQQLPVQDTCVGDVLEL